MSYAVRKDGKGWRAVNGADDIGPDEEFSDAQPVSAGLPIVIPPVSPRQIRQALTRKGLRSQVEAAVAAGNQDLKDWWEFATMFERDHAMVVSMGESLGQTPVQLDDLWALAYTL